MIAVFWKEFHGFLNSLMGYIVIVFFLIAMGFMLWVYPSTSVLAFGFADLSSFFYTSPYLLMVLTSVITMKSFSEEKKMGALELLLTKPITEWGLVMGKYWATVALVWMALLPTLIYGVSLYNIAYPLGNIDIAGIVGAYMGLLLVVCLFCAIGIFSSALAGSQIVSFIWALTLCFILYVGLDLLAPLAGESAAFIQRISITYHYEALGKGLIDVRDVAYLLSLSIFFLFASKTVLCSRQW